MRILFVMWHPLYVLRLYESTLDELAGRGHQVHLGFTAPTPFDERLYRAGLPHLERLAARHPNLTFGLLPDRADGWTTLADHARCFRTFLFYLHPRFRSAGQLVERWRENMQPLLARLSRLRLFRSRVVAGLAARCLNLVERAIPSDWRVEAAIREHRPDAVVVTPMVHWPARQDDYVKSARRLGLPTAVGIASWDNLTTKCLVQVQPDRLLVWNEAQREEAARLHSIPARKVVVTGAQPYDQWFEQQPSTTREQFCRRCGLDPARPFLLYLCSSKFLQGDEAPFIDRWLAGLRSSADTVLSGAGALVRPYPTARRAADFSHHGNVAVWPPQGEQPLEEEARRTYFDSLYHSAAVVGVNTSALIEAGIVGRRCFTILAPEFAGKQEGTVHFHHLTGGGLLVTARTFAEHFAQLAAELRGPPAPGAGDREKAFLRSFVRPWGLDAPATPRVVRAIEELAASRPGRVGTPVWLLPARALLAPLALLLRRLARRRANPDGPAAAPARRAA